MKAGEPDGSIPHSDIPETPVGRWVQPFARFFQIESASGVLLLACTAAALVLANSPWSSSVSLIWQTPLRIGVGSFELNKPLLWWINDGLMTVFFFVVGLEIKREFVAGELRDLRQAALPIVAALGGMIVPAGIYLSIERGQPGQIGWGIPVATDIAFVAGLLALLGSRVPASLRIMLISLAIADDIGAILLIACIYSSGVSFMALGLAAAGFGVTYLFNRIGVRQVSIYIVLGAGIWLAVLKSGVHPTVAGVVLGFLTPARAWIADPSLPRLLTNVLERLVKASDESAEKNRHRALGRLAAAAREGASPVERLEFVLHPWVAFVIMPLFALANAGVEIQVANVGSPLAVAVAASLVLGKPIGIVLFSWLATKSGFVRLPSGVNWRVLLGAGCLAGIGFTMSIFIAGLALRGKLLDDAKIGTLVGSAVSAMLGYSLLFIFLPGRSAATAALQAPQGGGSAAPGTQSAVDNDQRQCEDRCRDGGGQGAGVREPPSAPDNR